MCSQDMWTLCSYGLLCSAAFLVTGVSQDVETCTCQKLNAVIVLLRAVKTDTFCVPISWSCAGTLDWMMSFVNNLSLLHSLDGTVCVCHSDSAFYLWTRGALMGRKCESGRNVEQRWSEGEKDMFRHRPSPGSTPCNRSLLQVCWEFGSRQKCDEVWMRCCHGHLPFPPCS